MAQSAPLLQRVIASSVKVAARAGKIVRDVMSDGELNIVSKGKNDLQTEADRSAQRCIVASLSRQFPNVAIIGEEGSSNCEVPSDWIITDSDQEILGLNLPPHLEELEDKDLCIWVDPLDGEHFAPLKKNGTGLYRTLSTKIFIPGTSEYTQGLVEHVTVLIGVAVGERAVGGVIHQPYFKNPGTGNLGRTMWGIDGVGAGGLELISPPEGKRIITTTRYAIYKFRKFPDLDYTFFSAYSSSHSDGTVQSALEAMEASEILRVGGAGHKVRYSRPL